MHGTKILFAEERGKDRFRRMADLGFWTYDL